MTVKPSADVNVTGGSPSTQTSTTFTFTAPSNIAITGVTFKNGNNDVAASSTSSEPGTTFTVTLASGKGFTSFTVTYGYITAIGSNAFNGCTALTQVSVQKSDGLVTLGSDALSGCNALAAIVAPTPALAVGYQTATNWSTHAAKLRVTLGSYLFAATDEGGTAAYAITGETDLHNLAAVVNTGGGNAVKNLTFRQTANITLSGTIAPMGYHTNNSWKKGTYDGGGYTISGLSINNINDGHTNWHGLFGYVNEGTVKNVVLINPNFPNNSYSAPLIGKLDAGTAMNCYAYGTGTLIRSQINSPTVTNVGRARKVTLGSGVTVSPAATDIANGFVYNNESYYREGLTLTLSSNTTAPTGYTQTYSANGTAIDGETYTVNSTDGDVTITVAYTPSENIALTANVHDGNYWTTFYCGDAGYEIDDAENAWAYTAEVGTDEVVLHKLGKVVPAGNAVIIVGKAGSISMTKSTASVAEVSVNHLHGIDVRTATDDVISSITGAEDIYMMSKQGDEFGFFKYKGTEVPARKAFLALDGSKAAKARGFAMVFDGEQTGIQTVHGSRSTFNDSDWYPLDGRRLSCKPTQRGVYVNNGKKIVIR